MMISFVAPRSEVETSFWEELYSRKLNVYRLEAKEIEVLGFFTGSDGRNVSAFSVNSSSFETQTKALSRFGDEALVKGVLLNVNTAQEFKDFDKKEWIESAGRGIFESIQSEEYLSNPSLLFPFRLLSFADLKQHIFTYWFAFPALVSDDAAFAYTRPPKPLSAYLEVDDICSLYKELATYLVASAEGGPMLPVCGYIKRADGRRVVLLAEAWAAFLRGEDVSILTLDTEITEEVAVLGWIQRNLLTALCYSFQNRREKLSSSSEIHIIALRGVALRRAVAWSRRRSDEVMH